ncbi:MAG: hypothetical protein RJA99_3327 [Pseudomonadota bacterium]|jgi:hypothetical protein
MSSPATCTPAERHFCRHLAEVIPPSQLRGLLLTAAPRDRPGSPTHADWSRFTAEMLGRSEAGRLSRPVEGYEATLERLMANHAIRTRTKAFLRAAADADPIDAVQDAELLVWLMRERLEEVLRRGVTLKPY